MPAVSLIIPVYKVERYLPVCLVSIDHRTFSDFELILVVDGSPDCCGEMCDVYASTHLNTKVIYQKNGGLSDARNNGVKASSGDFIVFLDSDDYVTEDYIEHLYGLAVEYGADVAIAENIEFLAGSMPELDKRDPVIRVMGSAEALIDICYGRISICTWGKFINGNWSSGFHIQLECCMRTSL